MPGEFDFINWIQSQTKPTDFVQLPQGDDLAVLKWNADDLLLVGVDQVLDGVHFDSKVHSPQQIGRKVVNRNFSDCAAMACLPAALVVSAGLPAGAGLDYAKSIYQGMREAADAFNCPIVGGDTGSWPGRLVLSVTVLGRSAGIAPISRKGAKSGDFIYVTGPLGGSILGRHMEFRPRIELARELAGTGRISAMLDISDGLSRDVRHICQQSGVGAIIEAYQIPIHEDARALSAKDGRPPLDHALHDGEDHELLFTSGEPIEHPSVVCIGKTTAEPAILIRRDGVLSPLEPLGWQHSL
ncbi:MAG TPA: thiamine-phosphate kinase [Tepidisphaeraceae bacterium]|nr:thiamine-phosphate kinase [Tepidisphaeraceae bacterium]